MCSWVHPFLWGSYHFNFLCCVFVALSSFCVFCLLLHVSLDCPFLISPSVFSNVYLCLLRLQYCVRMLVLQVQEFNKNSYTFESKGQKLILFRSICYSSGVFVYVRSNILYLVVIKEDHLNRVHGVPFQLILMQHMIF